MCNSIPDDVIEMEYTDYREMINSFCPSCGGETLYSSDGRSGYCLDCGASYPVIPEVGDGHKSIGSFE